MLDAQAHGKSLGFQVDTLLMEGLVEISSGVAGGQDHLLASKDPTVGQLNPSDPPCLVQHQARHPGIKVQLAPALLEVCHQGLDDPAELVRADMGITDPGDLRRRPKVHQALQDILDVRTANAGDELTI